MRFVERNEGGRRVLELRGAFDGFLVRSFRQRIEALLAAGCRDLELDLGRVPLLTCAGVGALLWTREALASRGGTLRISELSEVARWTLATLGVERRLVPDRRAA